VAERIWSPDQEITKKNEETIILSFTASSEPEFTAWLLSFGAEGRLLKPDWLVSEIKRSINGMKRNYRNKEQPSLK
jgi:predicted DNA-binding transcriptional regulator YafY